MVNQNRTTIFNSDSPMLQKTLYQQANTPQGTASLGKNREVILLIRGLPERLVLAEDGEFILGRFGMKNHLANEVDLSHYGADERGVSRHHARLHIKNNYLYITDMGSTNGTFVGGQQLSPNQPTILHKGDEVLLGRLQVQILFR
jgi:hypothetical protein